MSDDARPDGSPVLVDWSVAGRRLRLSALVLLGLALVAWVVGGLLHDGVAVRDVWGYLGLAAVGMFLAEIVVVGGSALRGMLRAGERGERLAGGDVGLLPPQLTRRRRDGAG
ncbi:MAG: hypothetical protein KY461_14500 [Actinobacteria bacterium]|nr:hypothetical protein [Actinomycetota bacterium]